MTKPARFAVIDIGSIAVRLHIGTVAEGKLLTEAFTRIPLGLGSAAFSSGKRTIPAAAIRRLADTLAGMKLLIDAMKPCRYRAVATAAIRDAANRRDLIARVRERSGISIRVLSGREEAAIIGGYAAAQVKTRAAVVNTDIGGGSTDCAIIRAGKMTHCATFMLGTARGGGGSNEEKQRCRDWLATHTPARAVITSSGGSAQLLQRCCGTLSENALVRWQRQVRGLSPLHLSARYQISPDRAVYMVDAVDIYRLILTATGAKEIQPVQAGLSEALIWEKLTTKNRK